MKRAEYQKFHGFTDEDMEMIDECKRVFSGSIVGVYTQSEMSENMRIISMNNKTNIDSLWMK